MLLVDHLVQRKSLIFGMKKSVEPVEPEVFAYHADAHLLKHGPGARNCFYSSINERERPVEHIGIKYCHAVVGHNVIEEHTLKSLDDFGSMCFCINIPRPWFVLFNSVLLQEWKLKPVNRVVNGAECEGKQAGRLSVQHSSKHSSWCLLSCGYEPHSTLCFPFFKR